MAESSQEASSFCCIPDIFLEKRSALSTPDSRHGRVQEGEGGEDEKEEPPIAEAGADDLVKEGFIPYNQLQLQHLPEAIRTQENLDRILSIGERVVCVNNNELSDERNMEEEMKKPGVALKGTGLIHVVDSSVNRKVASVVTNRHVLYNNDELRKSTIDIFFDSYRGENQVREMERTTRGSGFFTYRQNSAADLCQVLFELGANSKTGFDSVTSMKKPLIYPSEKKTAIEHSGKSMGKGIVCVISHPLGRAKHVSFGKIVKCRPQSNTFLYDAPTKPGSSGAPIIVFGGWVLCVPRDTLLYHEGVDKKTKLKIGHAEVNWIENLVPKTQLDREKMSIPKYLQREVQHLDDLSIDEVRRKVQVDINYLRLGAFFPIFAAFILHPEKYYSRLLTQRSARPCQSLSKRDIELSTEDDRVMSCCLHSWVRELSSLFPPPTSDTAEPGADLSPFLTTEAPCWCQTIVEAVVHISASDKDRNVFLRPDAVCGDFRLNKTWPWSLERSGVCLGPGREPMLKRCLLKESLDVIRETMFDSEVPLLLLVLIRRANDIVRQSSSQTPQVQHGCPGFTEATNLSSARTDVQQAEAPTRSMVSSSDQKQLKVVSDVFRILQQVAITLPMLSSWMHNILIFYKQIFEPVHPGDDCVKNFHKALDLASHLDHHYFHDHPDSPVSQGVPVTGPQCKCRRPSWSDVTKASFTVHWLSKTLLETKLAARGEERMRPEKIPSLDVPTFKRVPTLLATFESLLLKSFLECKSAYREPYPFEQFLSGIDSLDNFRKSCDLISVGLTSLEVFVFNSRNLLRQYRQDLFPFYISAPVSVFGRPGRWAGGDTPEGVKHTAWKLIGAACAESRFGHECLEVLEGDAARREKMIDLYVDMKQLKFSGDIEEEKMSLRYMVVVISNEEKENEMLSVLESPNFNPTYFVMKTFLKLAPWPSWDRTRQMKQRCALP